MQKDLFLNKKPKKDVSQAETEKNETERNDMSERRVRGLLGFFIDLLNWLRMYRQRDFWVQIVAVVVGVFLWIIFQGIGGAFTVFSVLALLGFIMTNIAWAISRKPYSCVIGGSVAYGLYNLAVGVVVHQQSLTDALLSVLIGVAYGFVFTWFAFAILYFVGLIRIGKPSKKRDVSGQSQIS